MTELTLSPENGNEEWEITFCSNRFTDKRFLSISVDNCDGKGECEYYITSISDVKALIEYLNVIVKQIEENIIEVI